MAEVVDSIIVELAKRSAAMPIERSEVPQREPHFATFCEMVDASRVEDAALNAAPGAAVIELAKLLTTFDGQIEDEQRAGIIAIGGALLRLSDQLES